MRAGVVAGLRAGVVAGLRAGFGRVSGLWGLAGAGGVVESLPAPVPVRSSVTS
jgi:hypothetical protein